MMEDIQFPDKYDTKLDTQIMFMESLCKIAKTPLFISIVNSLKELKGIKEKQIKNLKNGKTKV
jgi:hypothetical protein